VGDLARLTAGLSLHALRQLLKAAAHEGRTLAPADVIAKVEDFIQSQLGEDIVEFKKPTHRLEDVIGFTRLKEFIRNELAPRFTAPPAEALAGAAVCGPIGGGKTFIFEAVAAELDMVVLVIKNIRSQWFGQTDVIFERLRRVLDALSRVLIFVDEADTQFGGVGADTHETERRLTGKIQAMMSDPALRGRVFWLLVTARIHLLSPDLRRPGRVGDLIIPTLDPDGPDRTAFLRWTVQPALPAELPPAQLDALDQATRGWSAAAFASLRAELKARRRRLDRPLDFGEIQRLVADTLTPAIEDTRRYQTLQALVNCTRRSLLPDPDVTEDTRRRWEEELRHLEAKGVR
jgi:SpoVK/Ycf46/Vps4 family AAA+-type ATPase